MEFFINDFMRKELGSLGLPVDAVVIRDKGQFATTLKQSLEAYCPAEGSMIEAESGRWMVPPPPDVHRWWLKGKSGA